MINVGLRLLPPSIEYVAWVDHDILIDDPDWPSASVHLIGDRPISVQPWGRMRYLDRTGRTIRQAESATAIAKSGRYPSTGPDAAGGRPPVRPRGDRWHLRIEHRRRR